MHDIWNPWHGCVKCSEGCKNCYMYYLDRQRGQSGAQLTGHNCSECTAADFLRNFHLTKLAEFFSIIFCPGLELP